MATTLEHARVNGSSAGTAHPLVRAAFLSVAPLSATAAIVAAVDGWDGGVAGRVGWVCLTLVWAVAGAALLLRREQERLGLLVLWFALLAGAASLAAAIVEDGAGDAAALAQALTVALLPAAAMHVLLALPSGALGTRVAAFMVGSGYLIAAAVGVVLWSDRPSAPTWPVVIEALVAAALGGHGAMSRYRAVRVAERRQMHWVALAIAAATEVVLVASALHVLVGWPPRVIQIAAVATIPIPLALLLRTSTRF
jgi:hypothetical protein